MDDKEFKDIALLMAVLGLTASGERVELIATHANGIVNELMSLRTGETMEAGILGIRKRARKI